MAQISAGKRLLVLGGGLSGLSFVHYLRNFLAFHKKSGAISKIIILEANNYMGGSIKTNVFEDGVVHELGPRSIRMIGAKGNNTVCLIEQLGLGDHMVSLTTASVASRDRYVYRDNNFYKVPASLASVFRRIPGSNKTLLGVLRHDLFQPKMDLEKYPYKDPPLYDFVCHRFGTEAAEAILDPLLRGIVAGKSRETSTLALFGDMLRKEQTYGSFSMGALKGPVTKMTHDELFPGDIMGSKLLDKMQKDRVLSYNLETGLQTLPEHLSNSLLNTNDDGLISIYNRTKVLQVNFNTDHLAETPCSVKVRTVDGDDLTIEADHIISTIPAKNFNETLGDCMPTEQKEALKFVTEIPHSPIGCVAIEYRDLSKPLPNLVKSFGFLTHSQAGSRVLGISFDTTMFPKLDAHVGSFRLTCMLGGSWYKEVFGTENLDQVTNAQLEQISLEEVRKLLKIEDEPHRMSTIFWKVGIAQYRPGHSARLAETRENLKKLNMPLTLLGQSYDGFSVNDVVYSARLAANDFAKSL